MKFSARHGYQVNVPEITIREDAPEILRHSVVSYASECGLSPKTIRSILCDLLYEVPDSNNWSDGNVLSEAQYLAQHCPWNNIYDIAEEIYKSLRDLYTWSEPNRLASEAYAEKFNHLCLVKGIGWHFVNGEILARGEDAFERMVKDASGILQDTGLKTASSELMEAYHDISKRPHPDLTGAVHHALAALEIVEREVTGGKGTLGQINKSNPDLFPKPLGEVVDKMWGYASQKGRHLEEGKVPSFKEAMLMIGLAASFAAYLKNGVMESEAAASLNLSALPS